MANNLAAKGGFVNAANQGAMKTAIGDQRDFISMLLGGWHFESIAPAAFTVTSGIVSVSQDYGVGGYLLASRAAGITTAFDVSGVTATNFKPGQILILATEQGKPMTVHHQQAGVSNGQLILRGGEDVVLEDQESSLWLRLEGQTGPWREISRSSSVSGGGLSGANVRVITSNANYVKPSNLVSCKVTVVGGGGGGAGKPKTTRSSITLASGGGGAGGIAIKWFDAGDLPATVTMTIGSGGAGGTDTNTYTAGNQGQAFASGANGGSSTFSGTGFTAITCTGGDGGDAFVRGRSGIGLVTAVNESAAGGAAAGGDLNIRGNSGGPGLAIDIDDNSVRKHNELGGSGGASPFAGLPPVVYNATAQAHGGGQFGAGGNAPSGGADTYPFSYAGAAGAPGVVIIEELLN